MTRKKRKLKEIPFHCKSNSKGRSNIYLLEQEGDEAIVVQLSESLIDNVLVFVVLRAERRAQKIHGGVLGGAHFVLFLKAIVRCVTIGSDWNRARLPERAF